MHARFKCRAAAADDDDADGDGAHATKRNQIHGQIVVHHIIARCATKNS